MDEGTWGGGFEEGELPFSVSQTEELVAEEVSDCSTHSVYGIRFEGEDSLELLPLESGSFTAEGQTLTAMAQSSNQRGPGTSCEVSDQTNSISWAVIR